MKKPDLGKMNRIGILGGTFDPIHKGHLRLANAARKSLRLDTVVFVPAFISPFKSKKKITPVKDRMKMIRLCVKSLKWAKVSDYEIKKKEVSYTVHTMEYFKKKFGGKSELYIIMGGDAFKYFHLWKDAKRIVELVRIAVADRPGSSKLRSTIPYRKIAMGNCCISSSEIRDSIYRGKLGGLNRWLEAPVLAYILKKRLYFN